MRSLLAVALILTAGIGGWAQGGVSPLGLVPGPAPGLSVSIWTDKPEYRIGELAWIHFYVSQPAYVYIFNIDAAGLVRQIFPNAYSPNPYVSAGQHVIPDQPTYQLRVVGPPGTEILQIIASTVPLAFPTGQPDDPFPLLGGTPEEGRAQVLGLVPEPGCGCYVTAWTSFQTLPGMSYGLWPCPPCWGWGPCPPCYGTVVAPTGAGWFCDQEGNWHFFIGECPDEPGWCWYLGPDGKWHFRIRIQLGG
ncbi:MAG TPA: DUF4384 domain-containing protein [Candidatus Acetothermia bacterium]|nr:DUF4384 domain-containing protein [Candidatus Acetothermia bacterium]